MSEDRMSFSEYIYRVENIVDEFVIALLSFGVIVVAVWAAFVVPSEVDMLSFGNLIEPWITMLALMLIARELWLINRNLQDGGVN